VDTRRLQHRASRASLDNVRWDFNDQPAFALDAFSTPKEEVTKPLKTVVNSVRYEKICWR